MALKTAGSVAISAIVSAHMLSAAANAAPNFQIPGAFVQPDIAPFENWSVDSWKHYLSELNRIGFSKIFLHWIGLKPYANQHSNIVSLVKAAECCGTTIIIGLYSLDELPKPSLGTELATEFQILHQTPEKLKISLSESRRLSDKYASAKVGTNGPLEFADIYKSSAFGGFYLPIEISDLGLSDSDKRPIWKDYYENSFNDLKSFLAMACAACAKPRLYVSGYIGEVIALNPKDFANQWRNVWPTGVPLTILFQDGRGTNYLTANESFEYFKELDKVVRETRNTSTDVTWGAIVELFGSGNPTLIARVREQIKQAADFKAGKDQGNVARDYFEIACYSASHQLFSVGTTNKTQLGKEYAGN